jgi:hypothetical protein
MIESLAVMEELKSEMYYVFPFRELLDYGNLRQPLIAFPRN